MHNGQQSATRRVWSLTLRSERLTTPCSCVVRGTPWRAHQDRRSQSKSARVQQRRMKEGLRHEHRGRRMRCKPQVHPVLPTFSTAPTRNGRPLWPPASNASYSRQIRQLHLVAFHVGADGRLGYQQHRHQSHTMQGRRVRVRQKTPNKKVQHVQGYQSSP